MAPLLAARLRTLPFALLAVFLLSLGNGPLRAQPSISNVTPGAIAPGATIEFQISGANLSAPLTAWTSFPAQIQSVIPAQDGKSAKVKIHVDSNTPPQIGGLVVGGKSGVSTPFSLMLDDLAGFSESAGNHRPDAAQKLSFPCAVDGKSDGVRFDHFQFAGAKGQQVSIEVVAHRLGSAFDPVVQLLGADGVELAAADDTPGLNGDCCLSATLPADGAYTVVVHDNQYRAGGRYRLRLGDFPVNAMPHPLGVRRGATTRIVLGGASRVFTAPRSGDRIPLGWQGAQGQGSALFECLASNLPEYVEQEPNDQLKSASLVFLPAGFSGVLQRRQDRDWVRFAARKGRTIYVDAASSRVGSPSFVMMRIVDAAGKPLASAKVAAHSELTMQFTPPADGEYGLELRDLLNRGGPRATYRVELRDGPDFRLLVKNDKASVTRFAAADKLGAAAITVQCQRRGYDGPIELSLAGDSKGFELLGNVIPAKANEVRVVIMPTQAKVGDVHLLRLEGRARIEDADVVRAVGTDALLRTQQPAFPFPPAWRNGLIGISINDASKPFFTLTTPAKIQCAASASSDNALELKRDAKDFKAQVRVFAETDEPGITAQVTETKGKYKLAIKASPTTAAGTYPLTLRTVGEHKGQVHVRTTKLDVEVTAGQKTAVKE